ncbi:hypothetical protein SLA2020_057550 [Shorea laevis]
MATLPPLFLYFSISLFLTLSAAQQGGGWLDDPCIYDSGNITTNSTYHRNLNQLLSSFTSFSQNNYGFYNVSVGRKPDQVNAIALCRGDVKPDVCLSCVIDVATELRNCCLTKKASQYYDNCMVRYSEVSDNSLAGFPPYYYWGEGDNATNVSAFNNVLMTLLSRMRTTAAEGGSSEVCRRQCNSPAIRSYALVQCTPDLTQLQCSSCLSQNYDVKKSKKKFENVDEMEDVESLQYDFDTIRTATSNFSDENKLGQGGFGAVYKGRLDNGQEIAVKRLSIGSGQGELEFKNEVQLVAKLQHMNLVKLHGFCLEGIERLLVYEFVPNSSLDRFLFDPIKRKELDWRTRYKIIGGIVRGILYLHEDSQFRIIHRDLKASNIFLDVDMNPKISDFGMTRLFVVNKIEDATSKVVGTYGYMAPEYII